MFPESVLETANAVYDIFEEDIVKKTEKDPEFCRPICMDIFSEFFLPKFLNGEDLTMSESDVGPLYFQCITNVSIESLKQKGLINTIEDESGEEVVWLTEEGKKYTKENLK